MSVFPAGLERLGREQPLESLEVEPDPCAVL
jgi:hypothetical protein